MFTPVTSFTSPNKPGITIGNAATGKAIIKNVALPTNRTSNFRSFELQATGSNQSAKPNSILCSDCEGNGAVLCSQCKGTGVNSIDHFNGQFKAGGLCWLCRGKKEILCGNCNGAGFVGGFMSTFESYM
ncbi:metal homeostatis protein bsd2 [Ancistrocladus abbreviatus]